MVLGADGMGRYPTTMWWAWRCLSPLVPGRVAVTAHGSHWSLRIPKVKGLLGGKRRRGLLATQEEADIMVSGSFPQIRRDIRCNTSLGPR